MSSTEFVCDECGSEWTVAIPGGRCLDCDGLLIDPRTGLKATATEELTPPDWEQGDVDAEVLLTALDTDNPYLQKLFSMKEYGYAPGKALNLLREVSPDPEEEFLSAIQCTNGTRKFGYLMVTTHYLRWIQTFPRRQDDFWTYGNPLEVSGHVITTPDGLQFQTPAAHARRFTALYRVAQQAWHWEAGHAGEGPELTDRSKSSDATADVADQLERIAQLLEKGLLTPDEFSQAKAKLLS